MTEEEKKKLLAGFQKPATDEEDTEDWTEEEILKSAKRIIKKLRLEGKITDE